MGILKKIKFNRFNMILLIISLLLLLFFLFAYFTSFGDYVVKEASRRDGDTIYVNDLASDYYYYLGMNYVKDLDSTTVNYQESDLKMVTINYYGYARDDQNLVGYVSLAQNERQTKFVYYKYFPIKNGQVTFDLIDNPFNDRPRNQGFGGWVSDVGTITTDSNTNVQSITIPSTVDTVNLYANWQRANVIYLNGEDGDDTFSGLRPDSAVGSWSKAFQLLEQNATTLNNRELNIIVLTGDIDYAPNYSSSLTHRNITNTRYNYTDHNTFGEEEVLITYKSGNTYYAINDNWSNVNTVQLSNTTEPPATALWTIRNVVGGYVIQNNDTGRYLGYNQYYNDQIDLTLSNTRSIWEYNTTNRRFFKEFNVTRNRYTYTPQNTITSGTSYLITKGTNPTNTLDGYNYDIGNVALNQYNTTNTMQWRITNVSGDVYTIYNTGISRYLTYTNDANGVNLALGTTRNWTYDETNHRFSFAIHHRDVTYEYTQNNLSTGTNKYIGYTSGTGASLLTYSNSRLNYVNITNTSGIDTSAAWTIAASGTGYTIRHASSNRYLYHSNNSTTINPSTSNATVFDYDTTNHVFTTVYRNATYYLRNNNGTWQINNNINNATRLYFIEEEEVVDEYDTIYYLVYDNEWKLDTSSTNAEITLQSFSSVQVTEDIPFNLRYDGSNFVMGEDTNASTMTYVTYNITRTLGTASYGSVQNNSYYSTSTSITATITSMYNRVDYRSSATWDLTSVSNARSQVTARDDLQLEYLRINATGYSTVGENGATTYLRNSCASLIGGAYNVRVGRGMTPSSWTNDSATIFCYVQGGSSSQNIGSTSNDNNHYRLVIESGRYSTMAAAQIYNNYQVSSSSWWGTSYTSYNYYGQADLVLGNDYDRALNTNTNLDVYYRLESSNYYGMNGRQNSNNLSYLMTVKSGTFGMYYFDNNTNNAERAYAGIYAGGLTIGADSENTDTGTRVLVVEGGRIANITGGLRITETAGNNGAKTKIYVKNGTINNIVGGAGLSTTYGDRYISVTGGSILYSVSGGSNGYAATGSGSDGKLSGDVYVHIGGECKIGTSGSGSLYGVDYGSVLGAGNGNSDVDNSGQANNSTITISDKAIIYGNVYGGGNYGNIVEDVSITIDGGDIRGDVYGGPNRNGVGTVTINNGVATNKRNGNVTITMNDGKIGKTLYGGSCLDGDIAGAINITINGGRIGKNSVHNGSVFGGGYGSDTNVASGVNITINDDKDVSISGTVYGGSALGTVIGNINVESDDGTGNGTVFVVGDVYCGSMGDSDVSTTGAIYGNCTLTLDGGSFSGSVYGGNNANGSPNGVVTVTTGGSNTTTISSVYGGGNQADSTATSATVNIEANSNITNAYGGGNQAGVPVTHVNLHGGTVVSIYGGSNQSGNITTSNVTTTGGSATNIYGGNNLGGTTTTTNVTIGGGTITNAFGGGNEASTTTDNVTVTSGTVTNLYGGGNKATANTTLVNLNGGTVTNTYGGGNQAGVTTRTNVILAGTTSTNIYGGSNTSGDVPVSNVTATSGSAQTIYGGNNVGGVTTTTNVSISNITVNTVYGGGCSANTGTDNVTIHSGTITNVYGGGESASVTTSTHVNIDGGNIANVFGGSNQSGTVPISNVDVSAGTIDTIYGGNNAGGTTTTTNVTIDDGSINHIYGGGKSANSTTTNVTLNDSTNIITNIFGGGKEASATTTNVTLNDGKAANVFGGSNTSGNINESNVTIVGGTYTNVYGSNNDGGKTTTTNIDVSGGTITNVFGGGNNAQADDTNVTIGTATISGNVYGGGNNAAVNNDTNVLINSGGHIVNNLFGGGNNGQVLGDTNVNLVGGVVDQSAYGGGNNAAVSGDTSIVLTSSSNVKGNLFGGGNNGVVSGSTSVDVINSSVNGSAYAGGNGSTAVVSHDTSISIQGSSAITHHVFGGGNAAATGLSANDDSKGVVNISGGIINGNVYGGANTSVLYGETTVNIGLDAITADTGDSNFVKGNIFVGGTVFGGGEANESGSEVYDFDFISVTTGITINIDGNDYSSFTIMGSIFGSGNASQTTGYSNIYLSNYGSSTNIKNNVSLQRADTAVLDNVHMALSGATDRTNEYSQVLFSLSRITQLDLKNNSALYLENGANLLNRFRSLDSNGNKAAVTIDPDTHELSGNTINQLYMEEDKVLNIALNQNVTAYGEVDGMTFFGMFNRDRNGNIVTAMYNPDYRTGDEPASSSELYYFSSGSYVLGLHESNHNIKVDGFYTNYEDDDEENEGKILVDYIRPSPDNAEHYMWTIGISIQSYDIEMIASKYSTLGTNEFSFINNATGNTTFNIKGFKYNDLDSNVSIIDPDFIPRIANTPEAADNTFGLAIKPGIGWLTVGETLFLTDHEPAYTGVTSYKTENSNIVPSFVFYLYHSKNLQTAGLVGTVVVTVESVTPINDLKNEVELFNFNITITRALFDSNDYEAAMTPGRQYKMFSSSKMDITSKSSLSAYYSLFVEQQNNQPIYRTGYHRVLSSNVLLPENTKITMIDFASASKPEYYYYIVNAADNAVINQGLQTTGEANYPLSNFIRMGSSSQNNKYDDDVANSIYFDQTHHLAIEEFIFIVDFGNTSINSNMLANSLLIELVDQDDNILHSVLGIERDSMVYNLYANQQSVVEVEANVSKNVIYVGEIQNLRVNTIFNQNNDDSPNRIIDTTYYDQKLGLKITITNSDGVQMNGVDLLGVSLTLDGVTHYARNDGSYRFKIADKVANVYSNIRINTENSTLKSDDYTVKVETFYSADGIYFGSEPADYDEVTFKIMDRKYGLNVSLPDDQMIISKSNGKTLDGDGYLNFTITYSGILINPSLKVALYRRSYEEEYSNTYNIVDILDYVTNEIVSENDDNIYDIISQLNATNTYTFTLKDELRTGTYKLEFRLYDGDSYVGEVFKYIIIK